MQTFWNFYVRHFQGAPSKSKRPPATPLSRKDVLIHFMVDKVYRSMAAKAFPRLECERVSNVEDLEKTFHLVYQAYVSKKFCQQNSLEWHYGIHNLLPESRAFIFRDPAGEIGGTLSLIPDNSLGLPMESIFMEEIRDLRNQNRRIVELGNLAYSAKSFIRKSSIIEKHYKLLDVFSLFKITFDYARMIGATDVVIGVHPRHKNMYEYLSFECISPVKSYPNANHNPAILMHLDILKVLRFPKKARAGSYFLNYFTSPEILSAGFKPTAASIQPYLYGGLNLWEKLTDAQKAALKRFYPDLENPFVAA